jgi:hypothetical protein
MNYASIHDIIKIEKEEILYDDKPFRDFRTTVYSQCGEDGVILEILKLIKNEFNFFVEFGAWDGKNLSNTANLRINHQWNGILFEADIKKVDLKNDINLFCEKITSQNINEIFKKYNIPYSFGLLSIDIDGDDSYCWEALSNDYKPNIVIIELNQGLPNIVPIRTIENQSIVDNGYFGANLNLIYNIAISKGYEFVTTTEWNAFFIRKELFELLNIERIDKDRLMKIHTHAVGWEEYRLRMFRKNDLWIINENF